MRSAAVSNSLLLALLCVMFCLTGLGNTSTTAQKSLAPNEPAGKDIQRLVEDVNKIVAQATELLNLQIDFNTRLATHHTLERIHMEFINDTLTTLNVALQNSPAFSADLDAMKQILFNGQDSCDNMEKLLKYVEQKTAEDQQVDYTSVLVHLEYVTLAVRILNREMQKWEEYVTSFEKDVSAIMESVEYNKTGTEGQWSKGNEMFEEI